MNDPKNGINVADIATKYNMGEVLGTGAFSKVYRAVNARNGDAVAVKSIPKKTHSGERRQHKQ